MTKKPASNWSFHVIHVACLTYVACPSSATFHAVACATLRVLWLSVQCFQIAALLVPCRCLFVSHQSVVLVLPSAELAAIEPYPEMNR